MSAAAVAGSQSVPVSGGGLGVSAGVSGGGGGRGVSAGVSGGGGGLGVSAGVDGGGGGLGVSGGVGGSGDANGAGSASPYGAEIGVAGQNFRSSGTTSDFKAAIAKLRILMRCNKKGCVWNSRSVDTGLRLTLRQKTQLLSGCSKALRKPTQFSRETLEICKIVATL